MENDESVDQLVNQTNRKIKGGVNNSGKRKLLSLIPRASVVLSQTQPDASVFDN